MTINFKFPTQIGLVHFIGIGGIGMSGIAEILCRYGYSVSGSDNSENANILRLKNLGAKIYIGHKEDNVLGADFVVKSSAIKDDNPEIIAAKMCNVPILMRAEMLAALMRNRPSVSIAGTHGKTTTTTLASALFDEQGLDPLVINGGIINDYNSNAKLGIGDWVIAEADESDGSFLKLPTTIAVVTNIDHEHMEHYGSFEKLLGYFKEFIDKIDFYGFAVLCNDHEQVAVLAKQISSRKIITYAIENEADVRATNIRVSDKGSIFDIVANLKDKTVILKDIKLAAHGRHNVLNSLAPISIALKLDFSHDKIKSALEKFNGVQRRFTVTGKINGVTIIDDYGHHPKEIEVTLRTAKDYIEKSGGKVIAVVQPHRYSRVRDLFKDFCKCFSSADKVVVANIYEAGEKPIEGINRDSLVSGIKESGHKMVLPLDNEGDLAPLLKSITNSGDIVVCLGAGNITYWAHELPEKLAKLV